MAQYRPGSSPAPAGSLLRYWRTTRRLSQLALAVEAGVTARHISFLETGRAQPSRDMILRLAETLDVPLRERNALLLAGGFAPIYSELGLDDPEIAPVRSALEAILRQQEPYPAVVMNRRWDILDTNHAADRFFRFLLGQTAMTAPANVVHLIFADDGLRPYIENWHEAAESLIRRVHREAIGGIVDEGAASLLREVLAYPGVPARWRIFDLATPATPIVPVTFRKDEAVFRFFSTVTTLGTPQDVTLQEIRLECFFPLDEATSRLARGLESAD